MEQTERFEKYVISNNKLKYKIFVIPVRIFGNFSLHLNFYYRVYKRLHEENDGRILVVLGRDIEAYLRGAHSYAHGHNHEHGPVHDYSAPGLG